MFYFCLGGTGVISFVFVLFFYILHRQLRIINLEGKHFEMDKFIGFICIIPKDNDKWAAFVLFVCAVQKGSSSVNVITMDTQSVPNRMWVWVLLCLLPFCHINLSKTMSSVWQSHCLSVALSICLTVSLFVCLPVMLYLYLCIEKSCAHNISKMYWGCLQLVFISPSMFCFIFITERSW